MQAPNEGGYRPVDEPFVVGSDGVVDAHEPGPHERITAPSSQAALTTPPMPMMIDAGVPITASARPQTA